MNSFLLGIYFWHLRNVSGRLGLYPQGTVCTGRLVSFKQLINPQGTCDFCVKLYRLLQNMTKHACDKMF